MLSPRRDLATLRAMLRIAWGWLVTGGRVRRRYRRHQAEGTTYWIDEDELLS
ncbi:MAG: hypothetical protein R2909_17260 [Gemmatimonadales bacterium]